MIKKDCFHDTYIESIVGTNKERKKNYEKVLHAFYLLEKLTNNSFEFIFKGGTSLMLLLKGFNRFSVDIDILMKKEKLNTIDKNIFALVNDIFINVEEDIRKPKDIIKRHFKFYYKSIYSVGENYSYVLLDIVFDDFEYKYVKEMVIDSHLMDTKEPYFIVRIPSVDEMIGDKMTAFAPNTIGILYETQNQLHTKYVEIIKQLYDIAKLSDEMQDLKKVQETYWCVASIQKENRSLNISNEDCLLDTINTCKLILSNGKKGGTSKMYDCLMKGYDGFKHYTFEKFHFSELLTCATKVYILSIKVLYNRDSFTGEVEKPINTFIGRYYKYVRQNIGENLYEELMKACFVENTSIL